MVAYSHLLDSNINRSNFIYYGHIYISVFDKSHTWLLPPEMPLLLSSLVTRVHYQPLSSSDPHHNTRELPNEAPEVRVCHDTVANGHRRPVRGSQPAESSKFGPPWPASSGGNTRSLLMMLCVMVKNVKMKPGTRRVSDMIAKRTGHAFRPADIHLPASPDSRSFGS